MSAGVSLGAGAQSNTAPVLTQPADQFTTDTLGYAQRVLADDPVAYWRLGDDPGTTAADVLGAHPGDVLGAGGFREPGALSDGNPAMRFDGITSAIRVPSAGLALNGDLTIEFWVKTTSAVRETLISKNPQFEFELTLETSNRLTFYQGNGSVYEYAYSTTPALTPNAWQHVVVTRSTAAHTISFYVNGQPRGGGTYQLTPAAGTVPIYIGRTWGGVRYITGALDEVAIYTHALTPAQIAGHFAATAGVPVSLQLSASDSDGDTLTYAVTGLPGPLSIDAQTGRITGTLTATDAGIYQVTATASDGTLTSTRTFSWTVAPLDRVPSLAQPAEQSTPENTAVTLETTASDPEGTPLHFSAKGLPPGLAIDAASGRISGTPTFEAAGSYAVTLTASDGELIAERTFTWTVTNVDRAPVMAQLPDLVTTGGSGYEQRVLADAPAAYWRLDEASGSTARDWLGKHDGAVVGAIGFSEPGPLPDGNTAMRFDGTTASVRVPNAGDLNLSGDLTLEFWVKTPIGQRETLLSKNPLFEFELTLETSNRLTFYHGNGSAYEYAYSSSPALTPNVWQHVVITRVTATRTISFYVNGQPRGGGTYAMTPASGTSALTIGSTWGGIRYVSGDIDDVSVYTHALTPAQVAAHFTAATQAIQVNLQLSASDPDGDAVLYSATGLPGPLTLDPRTGLVTGALSGADAGTYHVHATASDGTLSNAIDFSWTVSPANRVPLLTRPPDQAGTENAPAALDVTASDPEGTPLHFTASGLPPGLAIDPASGRIAGTPTFSAAGSYQVTVSASDGQLSTARTFTWTIANVDRPPVLAQPDDVVSSDNAGYAQRILADVPVGYWRLDDAPGTSAADATGANPGQLSGAVTFDAPGALADGDSAMRFDGASTIVRVPRAAGLNLAGDLTLETWVNVSLATRQTLFSVGPTHEFELTLETSNRLTFYQGDGNTYEFVVSAGSAITPNVWQHIVVTRDTTTKTVSFYVNGVPRGTGTYQMTPFASTVPVYIGATSGGIRHVDGSMDEVAVYTHALTSGQIAAHYSLHQTTGTSIALQLSASDPDGDALMYGVTGLPAPLAIDPSTGVITGKLSIDDAGTYLVTAVVSDGTYSDSRTFVWTVEHTLTNPSDERKGDPSIYAQRVINDGALAYWRLDDSSGATASDALGVRPGTILGSVRLRQPGVLADGDTAMRFDGATSAISAARAPALTLSGDLTLELWVNPARAVRQTLLSTGPANEFELTVEQTGVLNLYQGNGVTYESVLSQPNAIVPGVWQHVVVTRNTTTRTISFYVNGQPAGTATYGSTPANSASPIIIGRASAAVRYVDGWLDEVAVYNRALTPQQVAAHYALRTATPITSLGLAADRQPPQLPGTRITFTATASGGAPPYEFKWWILRPGGWTVGQDWSQSSTFAWTPATADPGGRIQVWARSAGDTANAPEQTAQMAYPIRLTPVARLLNPGDGGLTDLMAPLAWDRIDAADAYWVYVGTVPGGADLLNTGLLTGTSLDPAAIRDRLFSHWLAWDATNDTAGPTGYAVLVDGRRTDLGRLSPTTDCGGPPDDTPCLRVSLPPLAPGTHAVQVSAYNWAGETLAPPVSLDVPDDVVYVRLWTRVAGVWGYSDTWFSASEATARFEYPLDGAVDVDLTKPLTWNAVPGAEAYSLTIGDSPGDGDLVNAPDLHTTSFLAPPVTRQQQLYARLGTKIGGVWRYSDIGFLATPSAAALGWPGDGATDVALSTMFAWTGVARGEAYSLDVGTSPGAHDVVSSGELTTFAFNVTGMPTGRRLYARLGTRTAGIWRYVDSSFTTVLVLPLARLSEPVSAVVASGPVHFQWAAVPGASGYFLRIGTLPGADDYGASSQQMAATDFTVDLPPGLTLFARLYTQFAPGDLDHYVDWRFQTASVDAPPDAPPPSGLVAAYNFDEGTGSVLLDASGHGNDGVVKGAAWTPGHTGGGLSFDGASTWVTVADAPSLRLTTRMTLEAWLKPAGFKPWWNIVQKEAPDGLAYALYGDDQSRPAGYIHSGGTDIGTEGSTPPQIGAWVHFAVTYDGAVLRMYVNGVQVSSRVAPGSIVVTTSPLRIGGDLFWGEFFNGVLDDLRIYADVRTPDQIQEDMNTPVIGR